MNYAKGCNGMAMSLADAGERIIRKAYEAKDWKDRTYNLYNSYVSAVFYHGVLIDNAKTVDGVSFLGSTIRFAGEEDMSVPEDQRLRVVNGITITNGRDEAVNFLRSCEKPSHGEGMKLVVAAAMFYSGILESHGYHVLSQITSDLDALFTKGINVPMNVMVSKWTGKNTQLLVPFDNIGVRTNEENENSFNFVW